MTANPEREYDILEEFAIRFGAAPAGQIWAGDDAALLGDLTGTLVSTDLVVEGVHVDRRWCSFVDMGWKAVSVNVSDIAAMGGVTRAIVIGIAGASSAMIHEIMEGAAQAAAFYGCDIVGGDLTDGDTLVVAVTAIGESERRPIRRNGAEPRDLVYVTGGLGASAAGLRLLKHDVHAAGNLVDAHRRPIARPAEGRLLAAIGAHAMLDCSDGLASSVELLAESSNVTIELESVPIVAGATPMEGLCGGEDYELVFCADPALEIAPAFLASGLRVPILVGQVVSGPPVARYEGDVLAGMGYQHRLTEQHQSRSAATNDLGR